MSNKKTHLLFRLLCGLFFLFSYLNSTAQRYHPGFERVKAIKMAFIVEKSDLTTQEEATFWEVYEPFEDRIHKNIRKQLRNIKYRHKSMLDTLSNDKAKAMIQKLDSIELLQIEEKQKRNKALLEKLPAAKVLKIMYAEEQFNREMLTRTRNRHGGKKKLE